MHRVYLHRTIPSRQPISVAASGRTAGGSLNRLSHLSEQRTYKQNESLDSTAQSFASVCRAETLNAHEQKCVTWTQTQIVLVARARFAAATRTTTTTTAIAYSTYRSLNRTSLPTPNTSATPHVSWRLLHYASLRRRLVTSPLSFFRAHVPLTLSLSLPSPVRQMRFELMAITDSVASTLSPISVELSVGPLWNAKSITTELWKILYVRHCGRMFVVNRCVGVWSQAGRSAGRNDGSRLVAQIFAFFTIDYYYALARVALLFIRTSAAAPSSSVPICLMRVRSI